MYLDRGGRFGENVAARGSRSRTPRADESKAESAHIEGPQIKVQITFTEYDGEKKIKSLPMSLERSWVEGDVFVPVQKPAAPTNDPAVGQFTQPIIRQFRSENNVTMRDGQTIETNFATDPVSEKVIKLEVTINVLK